VLVPVTDPSVYDGVRPVDVLEPDADPVALAVASPTPVTVLVPADSPTETGDIPVTTEVPVDAPTARVSDSPMPVTVDVPVDAPTALNKDSPTPDTVAVPVAVPTDPASPVLPKNTLKKAIGGYAVVGMLR
jgi:hypothetical protein